MADSSITGLNELLVPASNDVFAIVDINNNETKKISVSTLMGAPGPIGATTPNSAIFTTGYFNTSLRLASGVIVNEFSNDVTLSGNSDTAIPTEKAVKTYIDTIISAYSLNLIYQDDSSIVVDSTSASVTISNAVVATFEENYITFDANLRATSNIIQYAGTLTLVNGASINEFSIDGTLTGNSDFAVPTEKAVKTYIDTAISIFSLDKIYDGDSSVIVNDDSTSNIKFTINSIKVGEFDDSGLTLKTGVAISEFSNDITLSGNSDIAIPTEKAVKTFFDNNIQTGSESLSFGDSTALIILTYTKPNTTYTILGCIYNNIDIEPSKFMFGTFDKEVDSFRVEFSSPIDSNNYRFEWAALN